MIYGLMGWGRLSVGAPYFNRVTLPFGLLMLVIIVLATIRSRKVSVHRQLPALLAHMGVFIFAAGIMVSSGSRHEISLNLSPGQQVVLAGYTFVSSVWIWRPKATTPVKSADHVVAE